MLKDLRINTEYRSGRNNVVKEFFIPLLSEAVLYKRAVGFFSSTSLIQISRGLIGLVKNGGRIELIASPKLSEDDIEAIVKGYEERDSVIQRSIMNNFFEPQNLFEEERLNLLANLIAAEKLDIKIAIPKDFKKIGIYHEKMGLIYDADNNIVAFSGSINETECAFIHNYEVLDVFCSWQSDFEKKKVSEKELAFNSLWSNLDQSIIVTEFPQIAVEKLKTYKKDHLDYEIEKRDEDMDFNIKDFIIESKPTDVFRLPKKIELFDYQKKAIQKWMENNGRGIFDMATGTGKTYTALGALSTLSESLNDNLAVFIVCPYQHLVEQWVKDIRRFNVNPLICYSKYQGWYKELKFLIDEFNLGITKSFCVVTCNASFSTSKMQTMIPKIKGNSCIVIDEAHNFGSTNLKKCLTQFFKYRLALSATIERFRDEEGTKVLYDYFGEKCIEFTLKDAIDSGFLTPYKYYPIITSLNTYELEEYINLTEQIIKLIRKNDDKDKIPKQAEMLLIKRARIIAGAQSKVEALRQHILPYKDKNNILVYCGATKVYTDYFNDESDIDEERQIETVTKVLGNELKMRVSMFTSKEKPDERERLLRSFEEGNLQALIAIKCLDEGVNVPGIRTAFILASSTNPKEYIQRRGRVLRKAIDKPFAEIFDFVVMPHDIYSRPDGISNKNAELSLINRELERVNYFMELCENPSASFAVIDRINEFYKLNYIGGEDYGI